MEATISTMTNDADRGAIFSSCELYRYRLWRYWNGPPRRLCNFLMLNPSTADAYLNDPTVERCQRRAKDWGFDGLIVTNLFAWRSTDPDGMKLAGDPVGTGNDAAIVEAARAADLIVCAWGEHGRHLGRSEDVRRLLSGLGKPVHALKVNASGEPAHPLYLSYRLRPSEFTFPRPAKFNLKPNRR